MQWVYFSPHFDDVALSCGGLVWEQAQAGDNVVIWTVCSAEPPSQEFSPFALQLHSRWEAGQDAVAMRTQEDQSSCRRLGASPYYAGFLDCIYRRHPESGDFLYASEEALTGPLHPADHLSLASLRDELGATIQPDAILVSPLGIGNHVDHQLARQAAEGLGRQLWYYADYPYTEKYPQQVDSLEGAGWVYQVFPVSRDGLLAWQDAIAAHGSQISTFWPGETNMRQEIEAYWRRRHGLRLWRKGVSQPHV